jgi:hypothetical protein
MSWTLRAHLESGHECPGLLGGPGRLPLSDGATLLVVYLDSSLPETTQGRDESRRANSRVPPSPPRSLGRLGSPCPFYYHTEVQRAYGDAYLALSPSTTPDPAGTAVQRHMGSRQPHAHQPVGDTFRVSVGEPAFREQLIVRLVGIHRYVSGLDHE